MSFENRSACAYSISGQLPTAAIENAIEISWQMRKLL